MKRGQGHPLLPAWDDERFFDYLRRLAIHMGFMASDGERPVKAIPAARVPGEEG